MAWFPQKLKSTVVEFVDTVTSDKAFLVYIISCMIMMPLCEFLYETRGYMYYGSDNVATNYAVIGLVLCSLDLFLNKRGRYWSDFFYLSLYFFMATSIVFSCDISILSGSKQALITLEVPEYYILYYSMLYMGFRISSLQYRCYVLGTVIAVSLFQGVIGIFQSFGYKIVDVQWGETTYQVYGLTQNTNFYGGLSVLFVGCCMAGFIFAEKRWIKITMSLALLVAVYCSINSMARLAWVGDMTMLIFIPASISILKKKCSQSQEQCDEYLKRFYYSLIIVLVAVCLSILNPNESGLLLSRLLKTSDELFGPMEEVGSGRGRIWYYCISSVPKHWATGVGLSNLYWCFEENPNYHPGDYRTGYAHNVYLQVLATQGVFAFVNYMALLVITTVKSVKLIINTGNNRERIITWTLLTMFVGYCVASFFNCRVFYVEFYFYAIIGLLNPIPKNANSKTLVF